jgi:hypothetical protein
MSLLHLVHQSVVLQFTESAKPQFEPGTGYVFRLVGVDGMGFLQLQDLREGANDEHEPVLEPYWINKDLVKEIHEYASASGKDAMKFTGGKAPKPAANAQPAAAKPKRLPKSKAAVI